jgi:hypothetical protein
MPETSAVTQVRTSRSRSVAEPDRTRALSDSQRRVSANRDAVDQRRRRRARQSELVTTWLRDLARRQQQTSARNSGAEALVAASPPRKDAGGSLPPRRVLDDHRADPARPPGRHVSPTPEVGVAEVLDVAPRTAMDRIGRSSTFSRTLTSLDDEVLRQPSDLGEDGVGWR